VQAQRAPAATALASRWSPSRASGAGDRRRL